MTAAEPGLPQRHPDGPFPSAAMLSVGALADRVETVASSLLASCGYLRRLVAQWDARAGLLEDRAGQVDALPETAAKLRGEAEACKQHAEELRTVLNTGRQ